MNTPAELDETNDERFMHLRLTWAFVGVMAGKLATMYLLQQYGGSQPEQERFRWALSARNSDRLKQVHREVSENSNSNRARHDSFPTFQE